MKNLASAIRKQQTWDALTFLPDDPNSAAANGVKPVPYNDPWKIKLTLTDLDAALAKKGEMIGAVLILGGPEIVPFHRLPNPTNDGDPDVASDNPYASLDQIYFHPRLAGWPFTGRMQFGCRPASGFSTPFDGLPYQTIRIQFLGKEQHFPSKFVQAGEEAFTEGIT